MDISTPDKVGFGAAEQLMQHLRAMGCDTSQMRLVANVGLLAAGERDHYSGKRVQSFLPVALRMDFVSIGSDQPVASAFYKGTTVAADGDLRTPLKKAFVGHVRLDGVLAGAGKHLNAVADMMLALVAGHRTITGQISAAYEHIELDPAEIARILRNRFTLEIGLERLTRYMALDEEFFELLCERDDSPESRARLARNTYEKLVLREAFIKQPCTFEFYLELSKHARDNNRLVGMDFADYYQWFRRSEENFDQQGDFKKERAEAIKHVIDIWKANGMDFEAIRSGIKRNFKIHPWHQPKLFRFIDAVLTEEAA